MTKSLHIVSFDVPFPANYGGIIDVYYKLVNLHKAGIKIHLHCFAYGRKPAKELDALCEKVYYYPRKVGLISNLSLRPYTVVSRESLELERNLLADDYPILFEVLHTCYLLKDPRFANRRMIYRHSNIEHDYYLELSKTEKNWIKKKYLKIESIRLKAFESILSAADVILAVNTMDTEYFKRKYPKVRSVYLPSFHSNDDVTIKEGKGDYILFHGNLSVSENYEAASWLIKHVFSKLSLPVVIAGLNPPDFLLKEADEFPNIKIEKNLAEAEMVELIRNAQVHVLYTNQPTGLKLKLLQVLFKGRFVICNRFMISGTDLKANTGLILADKAETYQAEIEACFQRELKESDKKDRTTLLQQFNNVENTQVLIREIFGKEI